MAWLELAGAGWGGYIGLEMRLYKILRLVGDHGVSVFPPEDQELPPIEETAGEPMSDIIRRIMLKGYTEHEAFLMVQAWAYHARHDLNQLARGVRVFTEMCAEQIPVRMVPAPPIAWGIILGIAVLVALALGLYLWATLDVEKGRAFGTHKWAYVMRYEERLWQCEVLSVLANQEGIYEQGGYLGAVLARADREVWFAGVKADRFMFFRGLVLKGRRLVFFHEYRWIFWNVFWCGMLTNIGAGRYRLREGGYDPYKPRGLWLRPGGNWGEADYEGCWQKLWWL